MNNDTKKCPFCGEEIKITAKKCKHCKEFLLEPQSTTSTKTCPYCGGEVAPTAKNANTVENGWLKKKLRDLHLYRVLNDANSAVQLFLNMQKDAQNVVNG